MKKSIYLFFYGIIVSILSLGIGNFSMANADVVLEPYSIVHEEIQQQHHLNYNLQFSVSELRFTQGNYEFSSVNELKPNVKLPFLAYISSNIHFLNEKVLMSIRKNIHVSPSLDGLTIIYPFHNFL